MPGPVSPSVRDWLAQQDHVFSQAPSDGPAPRRGRAPSDGPAQSPLQLAAPTLGPLFTAAPFLRDLAESNPAWLSEVLAQSGEGIVPALLHEAEALSLDDPAQTSANLRELKAKLALVTAIGEVGGAWDSRLTTSALADFADRALDALLGALLKEAAALGRIKLEPGTHPARQGGLALFALGKHGGRELNYSSDIDIVGFYANDAHRLTDPDEANKFYTRIVQKLVALMEERDRTGNIFRTDLRLRPDPGATPLALNIDAALQYYEARGQNWERAAWIKARPCAGDRQLGEGFLRDISPFIWRKHLDFATIEDIQAIKRQINLFRKFSGEEVGGHNVKLGRGGIREIEFFAQTQQLIAGGRDFDLRVRPTELALDRLAGGDWITRGTASELVAAYWYLRGVENRLQMRGDEQTHTLPTDNAGLETLAHMMGATNLEEFSATYRQNTAKVSTHYAELFSGTQSLADELGSLVFTGSEDDPETLETLGQLGFADPQLAAKTIRRWHAGGYPATRAAAARARLTALVPLLLKTISNAGNADAALKRFDHFIQKLPAGVQLFSLLTNNEHLCRLLVLFMASAPRLADEVIQRSHIVDGVIDPAFAKDLSRPENMAGNVDNFLGEAKSFEDLIDRARIIGQEKKFLISAGLVSGTLDAQGAGVQFATLAESLLARMFEAVRTEFARRHGAFEGGQAALLGFGKMASREMTATSDLDFILLYDVPSGIEESDGEKPLAPGHYFGRLTQRLISALAAPTASGVLYEADMRLRPSGRAGPLATSLSGFQEYQTTQAWTWEHLALTRSRPIYWDGDLGARLTTIVHDVLRAPRDAAKTIDDVIDMRARMARERKAHHPFDLKLAEGGLMDLEFMTQSAQLVGFQVLERPGADVRQILGRMGELGWIDQADRLAEIHLHYATIVQAMSTCLSDPFNPEGWTDAFKDLLAHLVNAPDFSFLQTDVEAMKRDVNAAAANWYEKARKLGI